MAGHVRRHRDRRPDLAAMIAPLGRRLVAAELPVLRAHQLTMWGYIVLLALDAQPVRTQAALAESIGADKTRIIGVLDDLQARGFISRIPDPEDRRRRVVALTPAGRDVRESAQTAIQANEERILARLEPDVRAGFVEGLRTLAALPRSAIVDPLPAPDDGTSS